LASDLSNIFKDEFSNTLEQLLSKSAIIESISALEHSSIDTTQFIQVESKFDFKDITTNWKYFIPTITATKYEYLMLGGMGDLKEHIDDEITDAVNEIISNICGSFCTAVNAQGFPDVESIKSEVLGSSITENDALSSSENLYEISVLLDNEKLPVYISFDQIVLPFLSIITGNTNSDSSVSSAPVVDSVPTMDTSISNDTVNMPKNLDLLYKIKLKLSVRLGTKLFLLKDILNWDIGEIIELEQMVNEPLEVLINGVKIGEGEAVIVEGKFGLKIKKIGSSDARINQIGL
jgi:flagellar motor switch protein FliN/FliY